MRIPLLRPLCLWLLALALVWTGPPSAAAQVAPSGGTAQTAPSGWIFKPADQVPEADKNKKKPDGYSLLCHRYNFDLFFAFFAEDQEFQKSAVVSPLKFTINEPAFDQDELADGEDVKTTVEYQYPPENPKDYTGYFPNRYQRDVGDGYFYSVTYSMDQADTVIVDLRLQSTGIYQQYIFKWDGCWFLSEIIDWST